MPGLRRGDDTTVSGGDDIQFSRPYTGEEEARAAADVVRSGWIVGGPQLAAFEEEFAVRCGAAHAVGVSSWTTGAFLTLHTLGIGPGDEVLVPSYTFIASVNVITHCGATPVFVDIDAGTWNVDPEDLESKIGPRTKLLLPVDQIGLPCDMEAINAVAERHGIGVVDDAACAIGSSNCGRPVGSLAPVSIFSLHARKLVTTGEGGMIVTDDGALAERLRRLRHQGMSLSDYQRHGMSPTTFESYPEVGYNFRITDIQAAIGRVQLAKLDENIARRRVIAGRYLDYLRNHPLFESPVVPDGMETNWQSFMIGVREGSAVPRDRVMERLHERGIPTRRSIMASHLEAPYRDLPAELPRTESAFARNLQLPMHPGLSVAHQTRIIEALSEITRETAGS
jgi:perosamine synthetase